MKLHSTHGIKLILQADSEVDYVPNTAFEPGLLMVPKTLTSGVVDVVLAGETDARSYDLAKHDIVTNPLLIKEIKSTSTADLTDVKILR